MPRLVPHVFNSFTLTEEEQAAAVAGINPLTVMWFHNLVATALEEKSNLTFDPKETLDFVQKEAYLKGQADILLSIIAVAPAIDLS